MCPQIPPLDLKKMATGGGGLVITPYVITCREGGALKGNIAKGGAK